MDTFEKFVQNTIDAANQEKTIKGAAKRIKNSVMSIDINSVNAGFYHRIICAETIVLMQLCKNKYNETGVILFDVPAIENIPDCAALGVAIGLMEQWCAIMEVPYNQIDRLEEDRYDFEKWYDGEDEEKTIKEAKDEEKKSINLHRLYYVRGLVAAVLSTLGIDWNE